MLVVLLLADVPGIRELTLGALLAGGALLGELAIAFQGLVRDGLAGLVALIDDHYAVGDVVDVGLLVTVLLTTQAGRQWEVQRALLLRLVVVVQAEGIALANGGAVIAP